MAPAVPGIEDLDEKSEENEGTVVAFYQQHVGNPINIALKAVVAETDVTIKVRYEYPTKGKNSFVDVIFFLSAPGIPEQAVALIELKRRGIILNALRSFDITALESEPLQANAKNVAKQATQYASRLSCRRVAIFDWDFLLLLDFTELPRVLEERSRSKDKRKKQALFAGRSVDMSTIDEPKRMTLALLGFILEGVEEKLTGKAFN